MLWTVTQGLLGGLVIFLESSSMILASQSMITNCASTPSFSATLRAISTFRWLGNYISNFYFDIDFCIAIGIDISAGHNK